MFLSPVPQHVESFFFHSSCSSCFCFQEVDVSVVMWLTHQLVLTVMCVCDGSCFNLLNIKDMMMMMMMKINVGAVNSSLSSSVSWTHLQWLIIIIYNNQWWCQTIQTSFSHRKPHNQLIVMTSSYLTCIEAVSMATNIIQPQTDQTSGSLSW